VGFFKFFQEPGGADGRAAVLVKMTGADGTVGSGQSVPISTWIYETLETATIAIREYLAPALVGRDPHDFEGAHRVMDAALAPGFTMGMPLARAGLDLALHDLAANLALYGAFGLAKPAALNGPQFVVADVLAAPLTIAGGTAEVPAGAGLGIEVDEAKVRTLAAKTRTLETGAGDRLQ